MATRLVAWRRAAPGDSSIQTAQAHVSSADLPAPESRRELRTIHIVAMLALVTSAIYLIWRTLFTVALDVWWISIPLLVIEIHAFISLALFIHALWDVNTIRPAGKVRSTQSRVAVFVPTYNESIEVLLPVVAAAMALEPAHETWVLDDGKRPHVAELARALGANYLTRPDNSHAKAGNINHALEHVDADFIAVLDADHVPKPNFLANTLGYFDDPEVALVQTPQDFYNLESFEHAGPVSDLNMNDRQFYHEQAMFYRVIEPGKNRVDGAFWCGTGAVVRVAALREVGGIATETVTEDIHTTIRLHRRGWRTIYHNEVLARGLAAADARQFQIQRFRWGAGAMQVLRQENPMFVSGLTLGQRLSYAMTLLGWFDAWRMFGLILLPSIVLLTGAIPLNAHPLTFFVMFIIPFIFQRWALRKLGRGYYWERMQLVFEAVRMTPNLLATLTLVWPGRVTFQVTPKGRTGDSRVRDSAPGLLYALLGVSGLATIWYGLTWLGRTPIAYQVPWAAHVALGWLLLNVAIIGLAIYRIKQFRFAAERRSSVRFETRLRGRVQEMPCRIDDLSLTGAKVVVPGFVGISPETVLDVELDGVSLALNVQARMMVPDFKNNETSWGLEFSPGQLTERARLAMALFNNQTRATPVIEVTVEPKPVAA